MVHTTWHNNWPDVERWESKQGFNLDECTRTDCLKMYNSCLDLNNQYWSYPWQDRFLPAFNWDCKKQTLLAADVVWQHVIQAGLFPVVHSVTVSSFLLLYFEELQQNYYYKVAGSQYCERVSSCCWAWRIRIGPFREFVSIQQCEKLQEGIKLKKKDRGRNKVGKDEWRS